MWRSQPAPKRRPVVVALLGKTREIRQIEICDGRRLDDPYLNDCLLPNGHPGLHSFDLHNG
jgi:hypothetical protein